MMTASDFAAWRKRMGYTYTKAAAELGLSRRQVMRYEKGERPDPKNHAATFDVDIPRTVALACAALELGAGDRWRD